jgi:DNA replicative helicase MCM subunit Mcm2 (Cdc46/Mcm family)
MPSGDYQERFESFFQNHMTDAVQSMGPEYAPSSRSLRIDWQTLSEVDPSLADDFLERPDTVRQKAHAAMLNVSPGLEREIQRAGPHGRANVRVRNLPADRRRLVGKCRTKDLGRLLCVEGEVADTERVSPLAEIAVWECQRCGTLTEQRQYYGKMIEPHQCEGCESKGPWVMEQEESELVDHQEIILMPPDPQRDDPPFLLTFLDDDITDAVGKGDVVSVVGVYETLPGQNETVLETYLDAFDLDVEEYAEAGVDGRELEEDIIAFVIEHQDDGSPWGVPLDTVIEHFEEEGIRRREIENTIDEAKDDSDLSEVKGKLAVPNA